jgi:hypothetical protein
MDVSGPSGCPKDSIMGYGVGVARADTTFTYPKITVVNGGQRKVFFYTIVLRSLHIVSGRGDWLATTYCPPDREWKWKAVAIFNNGQELSPNGQVACQR